MIPGIPDQITQRRNGRQQKSILVASQAIDIHMITSKTRQVLMSVFLLIAGCTGSSIGNKIENSEQYFGCYKYYTPVLRLSNGIAVSIIPRKLTKIDGFFIVKNSDFIFTKNQMIFDRNGALQFTARDSGFHYEFKRGASVPTLLLYDAAGREFELIKSDDACLGLW